MPLQRQPVDYQKLSSETLDHWRAIPPAIVSDCMNRSHFMAAAIKPLKPGIPLVGQARTVTGMVGDNGISHAAIALAEKGEVLVIDAGGHGYVAIWGAIMTHAAMARGIAGVVIDGANRDAAEIRELGFACYSRAQVPSGPHKGFGGIIDGPFISSFVEFLSRRCAEPVQVGGQNSLGRGRDNAQVLEARVVAENDVIAFQGFDLIRRQQRFRPEFQEPGPKFGQTERQRGQKPGAPGDRQ